MNRFTKTLACTLALASLTIDAGAAPRATGRAKPKPPLVAHLALDWSCAYDPRLAKVPYPATGQYPIDLTFGSKSPEVGIDDRALDPLLDALKASELDVIDCIYAAYHQLSDKITELCETAPYSADSRCRNDRLADVVTQKLWAAKLQRLFPRFAVYEPLGDTPDARRDLDKAYEQLFTHGQFEATSCAYMQPEWRVLSSREFIDSSLARGLASDPALAQTRDGCRGVILRAVLTGLQTYQGAQLKTCATDDSLKDDPRCKALRDSAAALAGKIASYDADQPYAPSGDQRDRFLVNDAWCITSADVSPGAALDDMVKRLAVANSCVAPAPGQSAPVDNILLPQHHYLLERLKPATPAQYSVRLNLTFTPPQKDKAMKNEYAKCLKDLNPLLWQPNGERMTVSLMGENEAARYPKLRNEIAVTPEDDLKRANSSDWPDITPWYVSTENQCPTIIHETMHILGLIDEYAETKMGFVVDKKTKESKWVDEKADHVGFDCRFVGPKSSVMSDQFLALDRAHGTNGKKEPLLFAGQWRMITEPGCAVANKVYLECGQRAYSTSKAAGGPADCGPPLPECKPAGWVNK